MPPVVRKLLHVPFEHTGVEPLHAVRVCQLPAVEQVCGVLPAHCAPPGLHSTQVPVRQTGVLPLQGGEHVVATSVGASPTLVSAGPASPPDEPLLPPASLPPLLDPELLPVIEPSPEPELLPPDDDPPASDETGWS